MYDVKKLKQNVVPFWKYSDKTGSTKITCLAFTSEAFRCWVLQYYSVL